MRRHFSRNAKVACSALPFVVACALAQQGDPPIPDENVGTAGEDTGGSSSGGSATGGATGGGATGGGATGGSATGGSPTGGSSTGGTTTGGSSTGGSTTGGTAGSSTGGSMTGGSGGSGGMTGGSAGKGGMAGSATGGSGGMTGGSAGKGGTGGSGATGMQLFFDDFESGTSQWSSMAVAPATWSIITDGSMAYQCANAQMNSGFHATSAGENSWTNVRVTARVKVNSPSGSASDRFAGLCTRFRDANNYHCLALRTDNRIAIRSKVDGSGTNSSAVGSISAGTWYNLRIEAVGSTITGYVDDTSRGTVTTSLATGRIALACPGMNATFDDVRVTVP